MTNPQNQSHVKRSGDRAMPSNAETDVRDLEAENELAGAELPDEEPRDVHKAGGGTVGDSQGGASTGRYGPAPGAVASNRERKPRGQDDE